VERRSGGVGEASDDTTQFSVQANFAGPARVIEHVLQIMLEGTRNIRRHAHARHANLDVHAHEDHLTLHIDDDGVGFPADGEAPWSIASRVTELAGEMALDDRSRPGAHLRIRLRTE
jgi:NarL family two-component system sensor histidine kinase LiaS